MKPLPTPDILSDLLGPAPTRPQTIALSAIRLDGGTQMRARLDESTVREYAAAMTDGWGQFPPVIVYYDGTDHWLGDGFHRVEAARAANISAVPADIRAGTRRDAVLHAAGANASHGLRRSQADKRRSVETLLRDEEWRGWADREIARRCNVSADLVGAVRRELYPPAPPPPPVTVGNDSEPAPWVPPGLGAPRTFVTRHGTQATMQTAAIGKTQPSYVGAWAIEARVKAVVERLTPDGTATLAHIETLRQAANTPGSALMREIEVLLDEAKLEFRRQDLVRAMHNVANEMERELKRQLTPPAIIPLKMAAPVIRDSEPAPVREIADNRLFEIASQACSAYELTKNIIRQPFRFDGDLWTCVGVGYGPAGQPADNAAECLRLHAPGEAIEPGQHYDGYLPHAYRPGTLVSCSEQSYQLGAQWLIVRGVAVAATIPATADITFNAWQNLTNRQCPCGGHLCVSSHYERKDPNGSILDARLEVYCDTCGAEQKWRADAAGWRNTTPAPAAATTDEATAILTPDAPAVNDAIQTQGVDLPPVSQRADYDGDEWYTPEEIIRTAAHVLGRIDTDPASCELAQTVVQAATYYTRHDNGLAQPWNGSVWLNPPYSAPQAWIDKLFAELASTRCTQAIVLVNNATETAWFQRLLIEAKLVCFPSRRLAFWRHDHSNVGARQGQALFYFGPKADAFYSAFSATGAVLRRLK